MIRELSGDEYSTRKELLMQNANTIENSGKEYERDEAVSKMMWVMHKASNTGHGPITRAPEWYAGGDYIEKPMETRENGPDSEFVIGLAGRLGWSEYSDGHKYGMVLKKRTGAVEW